MIEDIIAQSHILVDSLTFERGTIALSALRAIADAPSSTGPFGLLLGLEFEELGNGHCKASINVDQHLLNPLGIAHGGVTFSLADSACGCAAMTAIGEPRIVTQDMQIRYHGPVKPGKVHAQADVIHHGQRTITIQCQVNQNNVLLASVTATFAILSNDEISLIRGERKN